MNPTYTIRIGPEHVETIRKTISILERLEGLGVATQPLVDDLEELLFRAERENKLPEPFRGVADVTADPTEIMDAGRLLAMARERGLMPDEPYELTDPKSNRHHSVHADLWDTREGK